MTDLPIIKTPIHSITIPSKGTSSKFRPFLVGEEKLLLMAKQSENPIDILSSQLQIAQNCCLDDKIKGKIGTLLPTDIQWLYLQLKKFSSGGVIEQRYRDEDTKVYGVKVNVDDIKIEGGAEKTILIAPETWLVMRYPSVEETIKIETGSNKENEYAVASIDQIIIGEKATSIRDSGKSTDEILAWIDTLPAGTYKKIAEFFEASPRLVYQTSYTNAAGSKRDISFDSIEDFFI